MAIDSDVICCEWTPRFSYMDITGEIYVTQKGWAAKAGCLVTVSFDILLGSKGTGTISPVTIQGLPYPATGIGFGAVRWTGMATPVVWMGASTNAGTRNLLLYQTAAAATQCSLVTSADISDNVGLIGTLSYFSA